MNPNLDTATLVLKPREIQLLQRLLVHYKSSDLVHYRDEQDFKTLIRKVQHAEQRRLAAGEE